MSDHDAMPDPMDKAYLAAEALLVDEAAREARRAAVLSTVAREAAAPARVRSKPSAFLRYGGWVTAASVVGLGAFLSFQLAAPVAIQPTSTLPAPPVSSAPSSPVASETVAEAASLPPAPAPASEPARAGPQPPAPVAPPPVTVQAEARVARGSVTAAPAPPPPSAFPVSEDVSEMVVTARRTELHASPARAPSVTVQADAAPSPAVAGARLRAAAAAGRVVELRALLSDGAVVDASDAQGETALMKAVQANRPAVVALLRRYGADVDQKNRAGRSARDMAEAAAEPQLLQALGLAP